MIQIDKTMPSCCAGCFACNINKDYSYCSITFAGFSNIDFNMYKERMPSCPLQQIPQLITLDDIVNNTQVGNVVWLEVQYKGFQYTGMEPFLIDIDSSSYFYTLVNMRDCYYLINSRDLEKEILKSLNKDYVGRFRFWNGYANEELRSNTPWTIDWNSGLKKI